MEGFKSVEIIICFQRIKYYMFHLIEISLDCKNKFIFYPYKRILKFGKYINEIGKNFNFKKIKFANQTVILMKKYLLPFLVVIMSACSIHSQTKIYLTANGVTKSATLVQNDATTELISLLENGPLTLTMTENGGFEKVGNLPQSLPTSDERQTAQSGDIMLYIGNVLCIFYGSNTWAYTKLGTLDNMNSQEIKDFLSGNPVSLTVSLEEEAGVKEISASEMEFERVYDLNGNLVTQRPLIAGLYIINGKKTLIK